MVGGAGISFGARWLAPRERKVVELAEARARVEGVKAAGGRVALTNGCFDLLHPGHVRFLQAVRRQADFLVVGVNADASVRALKGPGRPVLPEGDRAFMVAALEAVDCVVLFPELTAVALVRALRPHLYAKGGAYASLSFPERSAAEECGARLLFVPQDAYSTTSLLRRLAGERQQ
ncbi:MAG: adenylyltransferase/cytidyltransferase family protein [Bacillota bacterium]|nr:adenylyltransferase/cytidyltransferase family protein [Bacillota bacterium]